MALDGLLDAIARDGDAESQRLLDAAKSEAARLRAAADARAERRCAEAVAAREAQLRAARDARRARALTKARAEVLRARDRFLHRVFHAAESRMPRFFDRPDAAAALQRLVAEALVYFPEGGARVRCRSGIAGPIARAGSLGTVRVIADDSVAEGVIVETPDGSARVDNTLAERLQRLRPSLSIELLGAMMETS